MPALAAWDRRRVALIGTASKSVSPSLRLGWLVAPRDLHARILDLRAQTHDAVPWATQRAFLSLLRDGYVDRVVRDARTAYARRLARVRGVLGPYADAVSPAAGMFVTLQMPHARAVAARDQAREAGFDLNLLASYCRTADLTGLAVGVGACDDETLERALAAAARGCALTSDRVRT